jgi:hypothetical protein
MLAMRLAVSSNGLRIDRELINIVGISYSPAVTGRLFSRARQATAGI